MFGFGTKIDVASISQELTDGKAILVDVREKDEWDQLHAKDALHLPVGMIMAGEVPTRDTSKKVYLYCLSGGRASRAASKLKASGYTVENLGGLSAWKNAGGATKAGT